MDRILKAYSKRLTNLSTRNKSLLLASLPAEQFLDLHDLDYVLSKPSFEVVRQLIRSKDRIVLCDRQDPRFEKVNEISKRIRKIFNTSRFIEEERGSRDLYVGYPFVRGKLADGTPIHAPLLFYPVEISIEKEQWCLSLRNGEGVILNRTFALAYSLFNETSVVEDVLEKDFDELPVDALEFRTALYEWLKVSPFRINFNPQLFEDRLFAFEALSGKLLDQEEKNGELKLYSEAVLGIFPQAGSFLVPDYERLLEQYEAEPYHLPLLSGEAQNVSDPASEDARQVKEEDVLTPFDIDEAQEEIVYEVKKGRSVVVQGPPGSGKSQLICNLMADFAAQGKRVLLVCQKRAALDVVYERLKSIGVEQFVALIHDFKQDRASLYQQLATQIEQVDTYRKQNYGLDAVFLEREFAQESRQIDRIVESLNDFKRGLFDTSLCGVSIKELYLTSDPTKPAIDLSAYCRSFRLDDVSLFVSKLNTYLRYALLIGSDHPWSERKSFASFNLNDLHQILSLLTEWPDLVEKQNALFENLTGTGFQRHFLDDRSYGIEQIDQLCDLLNDGSAFAIFRDYCNSTVDPSERFNRVRAALDDIGDMLKRDDIEFTLNNSELDQVRVLLLNALDAKQGFISGLWWNVFDQSKGCVSTVAKANGLDINQESLERLLQKVNNRIKLEVWLSDPVLALPKRADRDSKEILYQLRSAEKAASADVAMVDQKWRPLFVSLAQASADDAEFLEKMKALRHWLNVWQRIYEMVTPFLTVDQIKRLVDQPGLLSQTLASSVKMDFDALVEMDRLWMEMTAIEQEVIGKILEGAQRLALSDLGSMISLFENSLRLAWIDQIEMKFPELRAVTSLKMEQWEDDLRSNVLKKQAHSGDILSINLRERVYYNVENNRLGNRVTFRELNHQVTKKRKVWPIRKLLEAHSDEVFSLVPCWMTSPEAASAIFPLQEGLFDLVVFDEASQCYAEYGIPAAFRGKQLVVAGDSKQLRPTDLYKIRYEDQSEQDDTPVALEAESFLDLAAQSLPQFTLTGHYRSRSLDLIGFSNHHFYKNKLRLLPDFAVANNGKPGIEYVKVDGVWKNNANLLEVEKVVELLKSLSQDGKSVGVVTFNFQQQQAVQEVVEQHAISVPGLFIKNIENVQGDERDIIIFTTAYAPDEAGRLSMQFGTLNLQGGENRLNVAITRAREKIYLVTSLNPGQLHTENLTHEGPKMLKAYMEYALEVSSGSFLPTVADENRSRNNWFLKQRLKRNNTDFTSELPFSDIVIKREGVYKELILTDDDLYYNSKSVKDPHAYLPLLLKFKNWPFQRVYSREYWGRNMASGKKFIL